MSMWIMEFFGQRDLNRTFLFLVFMTAPAWLVLLWPGYSAWRRRLGSPFLLPLLYIPVWLYLLYFAWTETRIPGIVTIEYRSARVLARHPILILAFFAQIQIFHLLAGCAIFQDALRCKIRPTAALLLTWLAGPVGILWYAVQKIRPR